MKVFATTALSLAVLLATGSVAFAQQMDTTLQNPGDSGKNYDQKSNSRNAPAANGAVPTGADASATEAGRPSSSSAGNEKK